MNERMPVAAFLVLTLLAIVPPAIAADPTQDDITIHAKSFPPSCQVSDAEIRFTNSSGEWFYQVEVNVEVENDSEGPARCAVECNYDRCRCTMTGTEVVDPNQDEDVLVTSCLLPPCNGCNPNCDTGNPANCSAPDHCVCIYGTYLVKQYSSDGINWHGMVSSIRYITESDVELSSGCPTSSCEY